MEDIKHVQEEVEVKLQEDLEKQKKVQVLESVLKEVPGKVSWDFFKV
jgi:hypothetical protein